MIETKIISNVDRILLGLSSSGMRVNSRAVRIVSRLTNYANKKMKYYTPNSARTTGNLKNNIMKEVLYGGNRIEGISYVSDKVKYQYVLEYGNKSSDVIQGKPLMSFPTSSWKKSSTHKFAVNGMFVFSRVKRGKYKGKHYTAKALRDLNYYYISKMQSYRTEISRAILGSISIVGGV